MSAKPQYNWSSVLIGTVKCFWDIITVFTFGVNVFVTTIQLLKWENGVVFSSWEYIEARHTAVRCWFIWFAWNSVSSCTRIIRSVLAIIFFTSGLVKKYLQYKFSIWIFFLNLVNSCGDKAEFSAPLLQSYVSHDPSEIIQICWFGVQEIFLINIENRYAAYVILACFLWKPWYTTIQRFNKKKVKLILLFNKGTLNWLNVTVKAIIMSEKILF